MTYDEIFQTFYRLYRAEAEVPSSTDDEYLVGLSLANEAINYWAQYDNTFWKELFDTNRNDGSGSQTIVTGQTIYDAPDNMQEAGGFLRALDSAGKTVQSYAILDPHEAQFRGDMNTYAYFRGDPTTGLELVLNPSPSSSLNGKTLDYVYYKKPTTLTTGSDTTEMADPYFIVHRMLAQRFRASRNPYYSSALRDAENSIKVMKMHNDSGSWSNPWKVPDRSGTVFGGTNGSGWGW